MDIYKNIEFLQKIQNFSTTKENYRGDRLSCVRVYTVFQISISICRAGVPHVAAVSQTRTIELSRSRSRVVIRHLTFSMQSRRQRSGKRDIYIHTYMYTWPAARAAFVVSYVWERLHGPIIHDRYFSAESYLVNLVESSNQIPTINFEVYIERISLALKIKTRKKIMLCFII